ncbi:hypothetical protein, partial [Staphylococcus epidermidis]|uniref:hypothetical protein n=1 Tax=Staphylococcus epidermidis TaxID=1282 RepID=UPI001C930F58
RGGRVDGRIVWVNNEGGDINSNEIGRDLRLEGEILFDGERRGIRKDSSYKLSECIGKEIYERSMNGGFN